jgi:hypothetical protein
VKNKGVLSSLETHNGALFGSFAIDLGGFLSMSLPAGMFKFLGLQQSVGLFGSFTIDLALKGS